MTKRERIKEGVALMGEAIVIRRDINEIYKQYRALSNTACFAAGTNPHDFKRAVDALYYFGGGWPKPDSKGRMESLLENFVGMYRILDFIDSGHYVVDHLKKFGVSVSLDPAFKIEDRELEENEKKFLQSSYSSEYFGISDVKTIKDLVSAIVMECQELQREICGLADKIKLELRPAAIAAMEVEKPEYDRLLDLAQLTAKTTDRAKDRVTGKKATINQSVTNFHTGLTELQS